ncbi:unnamed protein product [Trifolium pratense]|uniref:Uncharacterized protein n=1 Tax=Trifolium pratense TaxID=57577 RepID=A0ACB0J3E7_TRIPR|nr:unnamed protein product [Trifolium pratense]
MLPQKQRENTSCTFLGPNLPDVWVLSENTSPHTLTTGSSQSVDDGHSATILEGTSIATEIKLKVAEEISRMKSEIGKFPKLVVVLVGDRRDSHRFIDIKLEACEKVGIETVVSELPENCTQKELLDVVSSFNDDKDVHGIVVQLPLPQHIDEEIIMNFVSPEKDVDGFHPLNIGNLAIIVELNLAYGTRVVSSKGKNAHNSNPYGDKPCTFCGKKGHVIEICYRKNGYPLGFKFRDGSSPPKTAMASYIASTSSEAKPVEAKATNSLGLSAAELEALRSLLKNHKPSAPSQLHQFTTASSSSPTEETRGDVCFEEAVKVASAITPVPGGIGPVTIAMLLSNTLDSAKRAFGMF